MLLSNFSVFRAITLFSDRLTIHTILTVCVSFLVRPKCEDFMVFTLRRIKKCCVFGVSLEEETFNCQKWDLC
jgi:hypothetical protein